ncbi:MAG TPA: TolC family protein [Candidatus Acidoferrales bacterium]|nr:TolC family protein [Candidatus Acidoferrales bacterium]
MARIGLSSGAVERVSLRPRLRCARLLLLLGLLAVFPTHGQQPQQLNLREALDRAARQNLDLAAARLRRAVAEAGVQIARQRPNPTVSFGATRDTPHESLLLDQPLELGGQRGRRIELARRELSLTDADYSALERQIRRSAREAYYGASLARGVSAQRQHVADLVKRLQEIAQARFDAGDVPQLEVFQAGLEVARAETELEVARQLEKVALSRLNALLNEPSAAEWDLQSGLELLPPAIALDELVSRAQQSNPALQRLAKEERIEEARRLLLQAGRFPKVTAEIGSDLNSPPSFRAALRGQLAVELPLFSRNQGEIAQSRATSSLLESEATATRRAVAGRAQSAYLNLAAKRTQVQLYRDKLLPAGRRLAALAEESYRAGKAGILTVLDAQRNAQQLEREYLDNLFGLQAAFAELEETVGASLD